ncbi:hypothetical protein ACHAXA_005661 [Cyclostephanos tholiformis]|uniref:Serine/threonine-protein phosphatase 2A activator n=1 Tax=Cyclostephanos tholiformis TaxID=382380 RepID=A0ABD3SQD7_9STRA
MVWGLDDYHCIPFYLGACQMMAREQSQKNTRQHRREKGDTQEQAREKVSDIDIDKDESANRMHNNPYLPISPSHVQSVVTNTNNDDEDHWTPSVIHNHHVLDTHSPTYIYLSCIQFIRQIKPNAPFFESSPMLDDISNLGSWSKAASGLLRLYEGEVLDKLPVVQHFVFGKIFYADWSPSRKAPREAPETTFIVNVSMGEQCVAPWADSKVSSDHASMESGPSTTYTGGMPPTRAPWAK